MRVLALVAMVVAVVNGINVERAAAGLRGEVAHTTFKSEDVVVGSSGGGGCTGSGGGCGKGGSGDGRSYGQGGCCSGLLCYNDQGVWRHCK